MTAASMHRNKEHSSASEYQRWNAVCVASVIKCLLLVIWCKKILFDPLKIKALEMAHMDPSEIIVVPLPVSDMMWFVGFPVTVFCLTESSMNLKDILQGIKSRIFLTILVTTTFIMMGAHPTKDLSLTLLSAIYMTTIAWSGRSPIIQHMNFHNLQSCFDPSPIWNGTVTDRVEIFYLVRLFGIFLVAIPFQILQILDHGGQSQRWPIPIILGTTAGYVLGTAVGIVYTALYQRANIGVVSSKVHTPSRRS